MLTFSGISITPDNIQAPSPLDLAVQMGRITRYGGAIWCPLLFHSFLVAGMVGDDASNETWAWALLHDAHEIIKGETPHPWKGQDEKRCEHEIDYVIGRAYGLLSSSDEWNSVDFELIKACDRSAPYAEVKLMGPLGGFDDYAKIYDGDFGPVRIDEGFNVGCTLRMAGFTDPFERPSYPIAIAEEIFRLIRDRNLFLARSRFRGIFDFYEVPF